MIRMILRRAEGMLLDFEASTLSQRLRDAISYQRELLTFQHDLQTPVVSSLVSGPPQGVSKGSAASERFADGSLRRFALIPYLRFERTNTDRS